LLYGLKRTSFGCEDLGFHGLAQRLRFHHIAATSILSINAFAHPNVAELRRAVSRMWWGAQDQPGDFGFLEGIASSESPPSNFG